MSMLTSSDSAVVHQKVALHLREFFECTKVLLQIKRCIMYHPVSHLWHADVKKTFSIDIDSLISSIEYKRGQLSSSKFEKLAHCLLEKLKAEISSHEHPYKIDISRDVEILHNHRLGSGSSATVFKCEFLGVLAAAKVFHTNCIDMQAVEKEAKLFSELRHPNVVQFIGYGVDGYSRQPVIVSELMSKNLQTYLDDEKKNAGQGPPLPLLVAINIMLQVAEAMNYLHEMGVIHRDLKATNVFINVLEDQDGRLSSTSVQTKLADFGESKSNLHDSRFTTRPVGTARWRAPEVFEDEANREKYTKSADVYSFAMVFFQVLTGEIPFADIGPTMVLKSIRDGTRPRLPHVDYCPGYLSALIEKCWATNPAERPQFPKITQLLVCCKNLILMHACPSPQIFFMHFDVTGKGHSHPELGHSHPEFFLYRVNDYGSIHGKGSVSRGGMSEDWKLSYGVSTLNVREVSIKDFDGNMIASINGQVIGYFGLLDQHINASNLSKQLRTQLFADLLKYPQSFYDPTVPIVKIYNKIDQDYCRKENSRHHAARLKASICVLVGNHLVVANVGDSRAVICAHGEAIALSTDQASY
jgi:serine/threonine protein kinase